MQQSLSNNLAQKQTLQLNSIQMQGLDVLQSNIQLLEQRINLEIVQNPLLEADYESPMHINDSTISEHVVPNPDTMAALGDYDENLMPLMLHQNGQELGFEIYAEDMYHRNWDASQEEKKRHLMDSITAEDHLPEFRQEIMASCGNDVKLQETCLAIIPLLDESGYFPSDETMSAETGLPLDDIHRAVKQIQSMEPAGIGAHSLRECLLLQLEKQNLKGSIDWEVVDIHLEDVLHNKLPQIAKALSTDTDEIRDCVARLRLLDPTPGNKIFQHTSPTIIPDISILPDANGDWQVIVNRDYLPKITIRQEYLDLLNQSSTSAETKRYVREKLQSAQQLIDAIELRSSTLEKIAIELLKRQIDFFHHGDDAIRPMTLANIAKALNFSESTISRGIADKYLMTPWGIRSFRHFFRNGYKSDSGQDISSLTVINHIRQFIKEENPHQPLSDQKIADMLKKQGIDVARRTIAKYRDIIKCPPASQRKQH